MKFNFKLFFVGLAAPVGLAITFSSQQTISSKQLNLDEKIRPYVVEVVRPTGEIETTLSGSSVKTDPFLISDELGAKPYLEDKFTTFPAIEMGIGSKITVYRAPVYTILDGKKELEARSWTGKVGELLSEQKIELGDDDKINFSVDTPLELGMVIKIVRVAITNISQSESIDYKVVKKEDKTLDQGKTRIDQKGQKGTKVLTYQVRREDGLEISRTLINTEVTIEPVDEIFIIGTKPAITGWCKYNDWVLDASIKNGLDPNQLCALMRKESNGHPDSSGQGGAHLGLFQYDPGFWSTVSQKAGYSGADIFDPKSQIYVTAWALTHGYAGRW